MPAPIDPSTDRSQIRRPEIQALRAGAVLLVLLFHLWPNRLPGGYVGVDVFFVISGFLITSHLLREIESSGRISLPRFWARRARRLLPPSLLVLVATAVTVFAVVPETLWRQHFREVGASGLYFLNWVLAADSADYFAAENQASPVQHFWSLAVEEQFYFVWPLIIGAAAFLVRPMRNLGRQRAGMGVILGLLALVGLGWSLWFTARSPESAYFVSPARAWEFGLGGLLAFVPASKGRSPTRQAMLSWLGVAMIGIAALSFSGSTPFPGRAALLPTLGTALVLRAGASIAAWSPMPVARLRPVQFLGDISYSLYLWHWPLIVLLPHVTGRSLQMGDKLAIATASVLMAAATLRLVENPVRSHAVLTQARPRVTLAVAVVAMLPVLALAGGGLRAVADRVEQEAATGAEFIDLECYAAAAMDPDRQPCRNDELDGALWPTPLTAHGDRVAPACMTGNDDTQLRVCEFGAPAETASMTVALIGDSHATHWRSAIDALAEQENWRILTYMKGSCPFTRAVRETSSVASASCVTWNQQVAADLADRDDISMIFVSASSMNRFVPEDDLDWIETGARGYRDAWLGVSPAIERVYVLRDVPRPRPDNLDCLQALGSVEERLARGACARSRSEALLPDPQVLAAERSPNHVVLIDLSEFFCDDRICQPVVGHAVVYRDAHHITSSFARSLTPYIRGLMDP